MMVFMSLGVSLTPSKNTIFFDSNDLEYFVYSVDAPSGCTPEPKSNGKEVTCTTTGYTPGNYKNMNFIATYSNVNNCFFVPPGNSEAYYYLDNTCTLNPLDNTYFFNNCYFGGGWFFKTYSDDQCTQVLDSTFINFVNGCYNVPDKNESKQITCGNNAYVPTTTTTAATHSYYNWTTTSPSSGSTLGVGLILLVLCFVFL